QFRSPRGLSGTGRQRRFRSRRGRRGIDGLPTAQVGEIEICYRSLGPNDAPVCLLVMGLGAQMVA
ncbi:MAG: hypothetical protein ACC660_08400, partial [Acidimicrobiales bacterium]